MMFGDVEQTANALFGAHLSGQTLFDTFHLLKNVKKEDLERLLNTSYRKGNMTISIISPSGSSHN